MSVESRTSRAAYLQRERLNTLWRVAEPDPAAGSLRRRLLLSSLRRLITTVLHPQEIFNAAVVEYINETASERQRLDERLEQLAAEFREGVEEVHRHREALAARERRIEAGMAAISAAHDELRLSVGVLQQATQMLRHEISRPAVSVLPSPVDGAPDRKTESQDRRPSADALGHKYIGFEDQFRGSQ